MLFMNYYPLKLYPAFKDYLWGGTRLHKFFPDCTADPAAEAWVLSCHKDGQSTVTNGPLSGKTLSEAIDVFGADALGENGKAFDFFPVLIKLIDAKKDLSVQVHPDDDYARKNENSYGKTEMWYVVDCEEGARLFYGFKDKISKEEFKQRIKENTLTDALRSVDVKKGDCFFIPSGTIHAIGSGMLIAEIQQNSNCTYRVYDYGRLGADGKPRQLHIEKALDVTKTEPAQPADFGGNGVLADCKYFKAKLYKGAADIEVDGKSFSALLVTDGEGTLECSGETTELKTGDCIFLPASIGKVSVKGQLTFIETKV